MKYLTGLITLFWLTACQNNVVTEERTNLGRGYAEAQLRQNLPAKSIDDITSFWNPVIRDSATAIKIAEAILFNIYSEKNIVKQRTYEIYHINQYWTLIGTMPKNMNGGTFFIILDSRNGAVINITHGK